MQKLTNIGFKRVINKMYPLITGYKRAFVKCKKCRNKAYYDFVPYSLSNPVVTSPCSHDVRTEYKDF